jgi:hypothetical protein
MHAMTHLPKAGTGAAVDARSGVRRPGQPAGQAAGGGAAQRLIPVLAAILLLSALLCADSKGKKAEEAVATRDLSGAVFDKTRHPVSGAVVYLTNTRTLAIHTYITGDGGFYRFNHLSLDVEYQVRAESNGHKSPVKTLSSFDDHRQPRINLVFKK